ncbi:GNAT family N-acetyltransferase [Solirubrobacter sp. CPCC 204708]|uniref:GNAT family N-acetyltransferase n=1 Tax=Solirubrobacter deserti TaxID=2282478 RepID=A0ABT4RHH1_9ACTN|nr:GNAT family N-acetyltransferase [Solirubrobacter deserti]MBE2315316.1 GNAT family N-acetyltransferase [Solirubrobacter deserti]MDA0138001.1 GNAT family N-acetyltransferase [Solirubrobacter deserti]
MCALPWPSPPLSDGVVTLRPWQPDDIPAMLVAFHDPVFQRFSDWAPLTDAAAREHFSDLERARLRGEVLDLAIVDPAVLGGVSLHGVAGERGRIGYWLAPDARGRGVATRAVRLLVRWAFDAVGLTRLELTCGPDNVASHCVAERCGFRREALLRAHQPFKGGMRDSVVYGLQNTRL